MISAKSFLRGLTVATGLAAAVLLTGCASSLGPVEPPDEPRAAGLVVDVANVCPALAPCEGHRAVLAKLKGDGPMDAESFHVALDSRLVKRGGFGSWGRRYFFPNLPPGRYALVGVAVQTGFFFFARVWNYTLPSEEMVRAYPLEVLPGTVTAGGAFDPGETGMTPDRLKEGDRVQQYYGENTKTLVNTAGFPQEILRPPPLFHLHMVKKGGVQQDEPFLRSQLAETRKEIGGDGWTAAIDRRVMVMEGKTPPALPPSMAVAPVMRDTVAPAPGPTPKAAPPPPPAPSTGGDPNGKALAVFPPKYVGILRPERIPAWNTGILEDVAALGNKNGFRVSHSVFPSPGAKPLNSEALEEPTWAGGSIFSGAEPDLPFVKQKAKEMGAELVLAWRIVGGGGGTLKATVLDVLTGRTYTQSGRLGGLGWKGPANRVLRKVFAAYQEDR